MKDYILNADHVKRDENVCEHGDHPAPVGKRFCGYACETCEHNAFGISSEGCTGLCDRLREAGES